MTLGAPLVRDQDPIVRNAGNLLLAMAISGNVVPQALGEDLLRLDQDLIEIEIAQGKPGRAAVAYYNFGEHLGSFGQHHLALAAYTAAAHYDPRYSDFDYFQRDLGEVHLHLGDYEAAASAYQKALQRGGDPSQLVPFLADSLMLSG
jgi:tetratricopeptide (TPR) repeat protein